MRYPILLPDPEERLTQDAEWCRARIRGRWREVRFHDYQELYEIEGLYERLFYDVLQCESPATVRQLLESELAEADVAPDELRVLDLGAGNGIMGEELVDLGVDAVVGVDIIPEAAEAARRDRPEVYDDYHVVDMTNLPPDEREELEAHCFNCLTCVAALGFGDIPPRAFQEAYNLVEPGGWVAFNIKEDFLDGADRSGFSRLIADAVGEGHLCLRTTERYRHRLSTAGEPLHYVAMVGTKADDLPEGIVPG